ncbi:phasin family protein [Methylobacterium symbioticum]|uniref:Phasin domain-containing protein n=1 Tax=Methylobacterium symbioticum TaxID=2584084 RepID=A0A509EKM0_9HYPH|nr:phasin family protein [Methylobacterium symbioticum]VUD74681.1 hypothetical protein MET9862_05314 [Methylobacterium symbioticum]
MSGATMFQPFLSLPFGGAFGAPGMGAQALPDLGLKSLGAASRTAWSIGIEWYDYAKQAQDIAVAAAERLAGARSAGGILAVQMSYLREAGELNAARMPIFYDLSLALLNDLARIPAARGR